MTRIEVTISDDLAATLVTALTALTKYLKINIYNDDVDAKIAQPSTNVCEDDEENFSPPTLEEIRTYCNKKGYRNFDVKRFHDYYSVRKWVSKNGMDMIPNKGWQRTLDSWLGNGINCQSNAQSFTPIVPRVNAQEKYEVILEE